MMQHDGPAARRQFTQAARDAALSRRRELAALPKAPLGTLSLFVTRGGEHANGFGWEIRRYGALVVARGATSYRDPDAAREAGRKALEAATAARRDDTSSAAGSPGPGRASGGRRDAERRRPSSQAVVGDAGLQPV